MNANCYKIIFSKRLGTLVAVGEHTSSTGKAASGQGCRGSVVADGFVGALRFTFASVALACLSLGNTQAQSSPIASTALPQGGSVSTGSATISTQSAAMAITQSTDKASINWQSFNIGSAASVNIAQPSANSVLLNRVVGNDPSQILGKLSANGQVILLNPNGVLFGKDGSVTASSFTASTFALSDADFMAGYYKYKRNSSTAAVVNQGTIETSAGGFVALIGATVTNEGTIRAPQGDVVMAAAESVTLPEELVKPQPVTTPNTVSVRMSKRVRLELDPAAINTAVNNTESGVIVTEGGQVLLQAAALSTAVASVTHSGRIDTSAPQAGAVTVLADNGVIKVDGSIKANSSGSDSQGQAGTGGDIIIGRDVDTGVLAKTADVSGAVLESDKGFVETSGEYLDSSGVKVKAAQWLLDPNNIEINLTNVAVTAGNSVVLAGDIANALTAGTTVTIATGTGAGSTSSATGVSEATAGTGNTSAGTIAVNSAITSNYTGASNPVLTLSAASNITVGAAITATGSDIVLKSTGGSIYNTAAISGRNVSIDNTGGEINPTTGAITKGSSAGTTGADGINVGANITASGNLNLYGLATSDVGIRIASAKTLTGGNIQAVGETGSVYGLWVGSGASIVTTATSGSNLITAIGRSSGGGGAGTVALTNLTLRAASGSTLHLKGQAVGLAPGAPANTRGIRIDGVVDSYGAITLTGESGSTEGVLVQGGNINVREGSLTINGTMTANGGGWRNGVTISRPIYLYNNTSLTVEGKAANQSSSMTVGQAEKGVNIGAVIESAAGQTGGDVTIIGYTSSVQNSIGADIGGNISTGGNIKIIGQTLGNSTGNSVNLNSVITSTSGNVTVQSIGGKINQVAARTISARNITIDNTGAGLSSLIADTTAGLNLALGTSMGGSVNNVTGAVTAGSGTASTGTGVTLNANLTATGNINIQGAQASAGAGVNIANTSTLTSSGVGASINASSNYDLVHSGSITNQASGGVAATIRLTSSSGSVSGAGSLASSGVSASGGGITVDTATAGTLSGVISGSGSLTKTGAGTSTLTASNTYTGITTISAGTLQVGNGGATGTLGSSNVVNNAALIFNRDASADLSVAGAISGSGTLTQAGAGKTILTSDNTYTGATTISGGTLQIGNGGATGNLGSTSGVTLSNNANLSFNKNTNTTIDKAISGDGNVTATITGNLELTSDIALTGTNTINLTASGDITETSGSLAATNLYMTATSGDIGSTSNRIRSNVSNLSLNTAGSAFVTEANSVSVAAIVGDLDMATTNGTLTVSAVNSITGITATGDVALTGSTTTDTGMYIGQNITATGDVTLTGTTSSNTGLVSGIKSAMTVSGQNITMLASATGTGGALGYYGAGGVFNASQQLDLTGTTGGTANGFYSFTGGFTSGTGMAISGTSASGQGVGLDNGITLTNGSSGGISITGTATDATKQAMGLRGTAITNGGGNTSLTATNGVLFTSGGNPGAWGGVARTNTIANSGTGAVQITAGNGSTTNSGSIDGSVLAITQNGNGGVVVRTSGTGNVLSPKVTNAGTGDVVVAAGSAIAAGTGTGGQVMSVASNTVTQNSTGKTYIYTGSASGTGDMGIISPAFDTLYYNGTTYTHNAAFNTAYGSTIAGGANAQVLFRDAAAPAFTLALPTVALTKTYGQSDPTLATVRSAVQTAYTAASGATTLTTDVAGVGGSNTFGLDASEAIAALTSARVTGESVNAGTPYVYSLSASTLNTTGTGTGVTLTIDKAALTAVLTGTATKQYDGFTNATLSNANYSLTGWAGAEGASVAQTLGAYADPNVANNTALSKGVVSATLNNANFTANAGTDLNNYTLPTSATGNIGVITAAPLTIQVNNTSAFVTQDANTATDQGFSYTGFKNGESAATALSGSFTRTYTGANTPSAGTYTGVYDISATPTATNGNYAITVQKGNLVVVPADKLLITLGSQSDTYGSRTSTNGGTASTVTAEYCFDHSVACAGANIASLSMTQLSGNQWKAADNTGSFVVFDTSLINANYSTGGFLKAGNYTYAASEIVPLSLPNGNFTGRATNGGVLTVGTLAVSPNTSSISKTYDGSSSLAGAALAATGALAGDDVAITPSTGAFASVNVGSGIAYSSVGLSLSGADMANYSLAANSASGTGTITAKQLLWSGTTVANKTFDGNTTATVTSNGTLSGLVGTETLNLTQVAATFDTAAVGTNKTVALSASLQNGTNGGLASNYTLGAASTTADITAANNAGGTQPIVHPPKPIIPTDTSSEGGGGSNSGGSSGGNPYLLMPARPTNADRCTPNTLEDCLCETQEARSIEGLAICYQPKKTASNRPAKGRRS